MRVCCGLLILAWLACPLLMPAQQSLARRLDAKEKELERLYADYWGGEYRIALGDEHASSRPAQENIRAVVIDDTFIKSLQSAHFRNRLLRRRRDLFLEEATYTKISNDPKLTSIVEEIVQRENGMRYKVGYRRLTRAELTETLFHNPNRELREQAWKAQAQITAINGERIRQAIRASHPVRPTSVRNSESGFTYV